MQIKAVFDKIKRKYYVTGEKPMELNQLFGQKQKGSKCIRKILDYVKSDNIFFERLTQVKTFHKCTATTYVNENLWKLNFSKWNIYGLPNNFKIFLFKYYNNILGTGNRVLHIDPTKDPSCGFCQANKILPAPLESFPHVFFDCQIVQPIINKFAVKYIVPNVNREIFFTNNFGCENRCNLPITILMDCLRFVIWQLKLQKSALSYHTVEHETIYLFETITGSCRKLDHKLNNCALIYADGGGAAGGR